MVDNFPSPFLANEYVGGDEKPLVKCLVAYDVTDVPKQVGDGISAIDNG